MKAPINFETRVEMERKKGTGFTYKGETFTIGPTGISSDHSVWVIPNSGVYMTNYVLLITIDWDGNKATFTKVKTGDGYDGVPVLRKNITPKMFITYNNFVEFVKLCVESLIENKVF